MDHQVSRLSGWAGNEYGNSIAPLFKQSLNIMTFCIYFLFLYETFCHIFIHNYRMLRTAVSNLTQFYIMLHSKQTNLFEKIQCLIKCIIYNDYTFHCSSGYCIFEDKDVFVKNANKKSK